MVADQRRDRWRRLGLDICCIVVGVLVVLAIWLSIMIALASNWEKRPKMPTQPAAAAVPAPLRALQLRAAPKEFGVARFNTPMHIAPASESADAAFPTLLAAAHDWPGQPCRWQSPVAPGLFMPAPDALSCDVVGAAVLATNVFSTRRDPQRGFFAGRNNLEYMRAWIETSLPFRHRGAAIVFYDNQKFLATAPQWHEAASQGVVYVLVNLALIGFSPAESLNDVRFCVYEAFFQHLTRACPALRHLLLTDASDIKFARDPFDFMTLVKPHVPLFAGRDQPILLGRNRYVREKLEMFYGLNGTLFETRDSLNAGVLGGQVPAVLAALRAINACIYLAWELPRNAALRGRVERRTFIFPNLNMGAFNLALHWLATSRNVTLHYGTPLTNPFMPLLLRNQSEPQTDKLARDANNELYYVYHK